MTFRDPALRVALVVYAALLAWMWWSIRARTGGMVYTLDDAYIHAAISRNIAAHGSFGIIPGEFAGASSSILWSLLLAGIFFCVGAHAWVCGVLASVFGALALERANHCMRLAGAGTSLRAGLLLVMIALVPALPVVSTGMEHSMHWWAMFGLLGALMTGAVKGEWRWLPVFVWALLAAGARYESLFLLPGVMLWLAWLRRWPVILALGAGMGAVVVGFGTYSLAHGGMFLPNSLAIKGGMRASHWGMLWNLVDHPHVAFTACFLIAVTAASWKIARLRHLAWLPTAVLLMFLIHLRLARVGVLSRYEAYGIGCAIVAAAPVLAAWAAGIPRAGLRRALGLVAVLVPFPVWARSVEVHRQLVPAAGNIRDQQLQMAEVIRHLGPGARVAVNDLGAVSFLTDARILDLWGLGDNRLARVKCDGEYDTAAIARRLEEFGCDHVICYRSWFIPGYKLPESLIPVESWRLDRNVICGSAIVTFHACGAENAPALAAALEAYRAGEPRQPRVEHRMTPAPAVADAVPAPAAVPADAVPASGGGEIRGQ